MPLSDSELCALIDRQCESAIGADDFHARQRRIAHEFYMGEAKGELAPPEVEGRSTVVSKDLMETIEWAMPAIMEALTGADDVVSFRAKRPQDAKAAQDATAYINYLVYDENEGFTAVHDAVKQCLLARYSIVKVYCDESYEETEERYEGLSDEEVRSLQADPKIEVVSVQSMGMVPPAGMAEGVSPEVFAVVAKSRENVRRFVVEGVPPEEFRVSKDARTLPTARFVAHEVERTASDLISEGWPKSEVDKLPKGRDYRNLTDEATRHSHDGSWDTSDDEGDESQKMIVVTEAYVRVAGEDGIAALRRVKKAGTYIHENEVCDTPPFALFTPILMPYKAIGLSMHDLIEDLCRIKTAMWRQTLDNVYLSNTPRTGYVEGQVNLDDLLNARPGGLVRMKNKDALVPIVTPFVASAGMEILQAADQVRDTRSGVTEMNSALNADSLSKGSIGSEGIASMQQAGSQRVRLIARVLAETGIKQLYKLLLKQATQYQDRPTQIEVNGRWLEVDPREWKNGFRLRVNVGVGALEKRQQVANLLQLGTVQERVMPLGLASPENIHATASDLAKAMGYHDPERYFSQPNPNPPPPQPPIELQLEQMKQRGAQQLAQIKGQVDVEVERMKQQAQAEQEAQANALQAEQDRMQAQNTMQIEQYKIDKQMEYEVFKAQLDRQTRLDTAQIAAQTATHNASLKSQQEPAFGQD